VRPFFSRNTPAHVTLRVLDDVPNLRSSRRFAVIRRSFAAARGLHGLRLTQFTVMSNHLHLIVEADSSAALSTGMQGLGIRLAKALNGALDRKGSLFADHYHANLLKTPRQMWTAIRYVLGNAEHHYGDKGVDKFSSAAPEQRDLLASPRGWLSSVGWLLGQPKSAAGQ
jgi:REP element-mobilizing transposase RayT